MLICDYVSTYCNNFTYCMPTFSDVTTTNDSGPKSLTTLGMFEIKSITVFADSFIYTTKKICRYRSNIRMNVSDYSKKKSSKLIVYTKVVFDTTTNTIIIWYYKCTELSSVDSNSLSLSE